MNDNIDCSQEDKMKGDVVFACQGDNKYAKGIVHKVIYPWFRCRVVVEHMIDLFQERDALEVFIKYKPKRLYKSLPQDGELVKLSGDLSVAARYHPGGSGFFWTQNILNDNTSYDTGGLKWDIV